MREWRSHLLAGFCLGVFAFLVGLPLALEPDGLLVGPQFGGRNDLTAGFLAFRDFPRTVWDRDAQIPLWNPHLLCGAPWLGSPQSGLFYPPNWAFFLPLGPSLACWLMVAHLWWGGLGTYAVSRRLGYGWLAGIISGAAFVAAPYLMAHLGEGHFNQVCLVAWIPWAFCCFEGLRAGNRHAVPALALVLALCFFCGHVQEFYYLVLFLSGNVFIDLCARKSAFHRNRLLSTWLGVGMLTLSLVAMELIPQYITSKQAVRSGGLSLEQAGAISLGTTSFRQLFDPYALGGPDNYQGPGNYFWETLFHFGWITSGLAVLAIFIGWRKETIWRYALLGIVAALIAFGENTPVFGVLFRYVPGFALFRAPARGLFFSSFAVAILAAGGVDRILVSLRKPLAYTVGLVLLLLMAGETLRNSSRMLAIVPQENIRTNSPIAQFLKDNGEHHRVLVHQDLLTEREAWSAGIFKVHGYDPVPLTRAAIFFNALVLDGSAAEEIVGLKPALPQRFDSKMVELLGVKYAVVPAQFPLPTVGWKIVQSGTVSRDVTLKGQPVEKLSYRILERETTFPRAYVLGETRTLESETDLSDQLRKLEPRQELIVQKDMLPAGNRQTFLSAKIVEYTPNRIGISASLKHSGYLVLTDIFGAGWSATVNGQRYPVVAANIVFRGVPLPPGEHHVELVYSPPGWKIGLVISGISLLVWGAIILRGLMSVEHPEGE